MAALPNDLKPPIEAHRQIDVHDQSGVVIGR
jgi:hypothetical protein